MELLGFTMKLDNGLKSMNQAGSEVYWQNEGVHVCRNLIFLESQEKKPNQTGKM